MSYACKKCGDVVLDGEGPDCRDHSNSGLAACYKSLRAGPQAHKGLPLKPYYEDEHCTIYHGDALELLPKLPRADLVLTDPPYIIGATSVGNPGSKSGTWADMMNAAHWFAEWYGLAWERLEPHGYMVTFGNWRSLPTMLRALAMRGIPATSCMVWDKDWIGPAYKNALRPTYELLVWSAKPEAEIPDRAQPDLVRVKWMAGQSRRSDHPAEKPTDLLGRVVELTTKPGALVIDPFMGSGSTLRAAKDRGRRGVGVEAEEHHCNTARARLGQEALPLCG